MCHISDNIFDLEKFHKNKIIHKNKNYFNDYEIKVILHLEEKEGTYHAINSTLSITLFPILVYVIIRFQKKNAFTGTSETTGDNEDHLITYVNENGVAYW